MEMTKEKFNRLIVECKNRTVSGAAAMVELYDFFFHKIARFIAYKYKNKDIGEDIAQSFFVKLLQMNVACEIKNPLAWVLRICDNLAKDYIKQDIRAKSVFPSEASTGKDDLSDKVIFREYEALIRQLDPVTRQIVEKNVFEGLKFKEIAAELNLKPGAARKRFSRGMKEIRKMAGK